MAHPTSPTPSKSGRPTKFPQGSQPIPARFTPEEIERIRRAGRLLGLRANSDVIRMGVLELLDRVEMASQAVGVDLVDIQDRLAEIVERSGKRGA